METDVWKFVMGGDCEGLEEFLRNNVEILRGVIPQGNSALHIAAAQGHHKMVESLVRLMPCMLLMLNFNQETPLHTAARFGSPKTVDALLNVQNGLQCQCSSPSCQQRVDLEASPIEVQEIWKARNKEGETALHFVVKGINLEAAEQLLKKVQGIELIVNNVGESPLYTACYYSRLGIAKRLLLVHPAVGDTRNDGTSCLHQAIINVIQWSDEMNDDWYFADKRDRLRYHGTLL